MPADYAAHLHILDKAQRITRYTPNAVQAQFLNARSGRDLILKARQQGISTAIQADYFTAAISSTAQVATLAHDDATTQKLRRMAKRFYDYLPDGLKPPRGLDNATTTTYPATGSEVTIATAGSASTGRGGTYSHIHGSEVAFWKDAESLMAGIMQGAPRHALIALESTPNGAQGWFYERCMEALDGNAAWTLHFFPWWFDAGYTLSVAKNEDDMLSRRDLLKGLGAGVVTAIAAPLGALTDDEARLVEQHGLSAGQIAWRRAKQKELGRLFAQEYPEDAVTCFLTSGTGYFSDILHFDKLFTAGHYDAPQPGHRYVAGLDFGQTVDYTALSVGDADYVEEVELLRLNQLPWAEMRRRVVDKCLKWGVDVLVAEKNSMGGTNIEELDAELRSRGARTQVVAFTTTQKSKASIVTGLHFSLDEEGLILQPDGAGRHELLNFTASQTATGMWKYEAATGHDDTVIARALMNKARATRKQARSYQG